MIQPKTPKKIKGARRKRREEEKKRAEQKKAEDTGIYRNGDTLYIKQEKMNPYLEAKLIRSGIKCIVIPEPLCEYAVLGAEVRETYPYQYKCSIMFECRYGRPTKKIAKNCPRKQTGDSMRREKT